jgi:hypothetical protein
VFLAEKQALGFCRTKDYENSEEKKGICNHEDGSTEA